MTDTCQGRIYDTEVCNHPERGEGAGNLAFWLAPIGHCYTADEKEAARGQSHE